MAKFNIKPEEANILNVGQGVRLEQEVHNVEAALEDRQEEVSEEDVTEVEERLREGDESGQAEADEPEVNEVEREAEER